MILRTWLHYRIHSLEDHIDRFDCHQLREVKQHSFGGGEGLGIGCIEAINLQ